MKHVTHYEIHPAAALFPMFGPEDFAELKASIKKHGLNTPITLYEGLILDGRNRYKACQELGIEPATTEYTGDEPTEFAWTQNAVRRQLSKSQKSMAAAKAAPLYAEDAKNRQLRTIENRELVVPPLVVEQESQRSKRDGEALAHAAKTAGVGVTSVGYASRILREHPELVPDIESGEKSLHGVYAKLYEEPKASTRDPALRKQHRVSVLERIENLVSTVAPQFDALWDLLESDKTSFDAASIRSVEKTRANFSRLINRMRREDNGQ